jgi:hypothetical protein
MNLDRATLSSTQLYRLAAEGIELIQDEKDRLSADYLYLLAITTNAGLSQRDKDRLKPLHLAHLVFTNRCVLSQDDKARLPTTMLFELFIQGYAYLSEREMACYGPAHVARLKERQAACQESLVSV